MDGEVWAPPATDRSTFRYREATPHAPVSLLFNTSRSPPPHLLLLLPTTPSWSPSNSTTEAAELTLGLSMGSQLTLILLYTLTTLVSVIGNCIVIIVFVVGKRSRSDLRTFLINLAVADLIMAIFCMPFTFTMTMLSNWIFTAPMCPIVLYMQLVSVTASVCTNMAIGVDRLWVVLYPLQSRITKTRSKYVIAVIWALALGLSAVQLVVGRSNSRPLGGGRTVHDCGENWPEPSQDWRHGYTFFIFVLTYLLPLVSLSFTYGFVGLRLWQRTAPGNADQARDTHQLRSKRKVIKMLIFVVVLFGICWLPLHTFILVLDFHPELVMYESQAEERFFIAVYYTVHWLAMSNSFVNPIIYGFLNDSFRTDFKRICRAWCPCCAWLPCLKVTAFSRDNSSYRHSRHSRGDAGGDTSTASVRLSTHRGHGGADRANGYGQYRTELELSSKSSLLRPHVQNRV